VEHRCACPKYLAALGVQVCGPVCFTGLPGLNVLAVWGKCNFGLLGGVGYCGIIKGKSSLLYKNTQVKSDCGVSCFFCILLKLNVQIKS